MPRINAPTVAAHRKQQLRALLDGARAILGETGQAPTLAATAERAGLARSSVYQYFSSPDDLLAAVVADVFPAWARQVRDRMDAAEGAGERVWAYVCANLELFTSSEQAVATALRKVVEPSVLREPVAAFHAELHEPLVAALVDHGEPHPRLVADTVDGVVVRTAQALIDGSEDAPHDHDAALAHLRRLLGGYLGLSG